LGSHLDGQLVGLDGTEKLEDVQRFGQGVTLLHWVFVLLVDLHCLRHESHIPHNCREAVSQDLALQVGKCGYLGLQITDRCQRDGNISVLDELIRVRKEL